MEGIHGTIYGAQGLNSYLTEALIRPSIPVNWLLHAAHALIKRPSHWVITDDTLVRRTLTDLEQLDKH